MRNYVTRLMFMLNGPDSGSNKTRALNSAIQLIGNATNCGLFASDCLITWAKSLGFLEDTKFMQSINNKLTGDHQLDEVARGTIWRAHVLCWAARQCIEIDGDYVEAGCYTGATVRSVVDYVDFGTTVKTYWLYDMFENDGTVSEVLPSHSFDLYERTVRRFDDVPNVRVIKGKVPDSFAQGAPDQIALLHIDMNNAPSERAVLELLYDRMKPGGMLIFDDYGWVQYRAQKDSADEFMARRGKMILELPTGQGLAIR